MNHLNRRSFLSVAGAGVLTLMMAGCQSPVKPAQQRCSQPHIVLFLADDLGWDNVGFHNDRAVTPTIDKLAREGARLEQFYVMPACSPTRASMMTGRYTIRYGMQCGVIKPYVNYGLPLTERLLPEALKEAGYYTAITGKWHLGNVATDYLPTRRGFDHQYGGYTGMMDYYSHTRSGGHDWNRNDKPIKEEGHATDLVRAEAIRIVEQHDAATPLFLYVPFHAPHSPLQVPDAYAEGRENKYDAMITHMDEAMGDILTALRKRRMHENCFVMFLSDNGASSPQNNAPLRGRKTQVYEGGVKVPAVVHWPGRIKPRTIVNEPLHVVDLYPTLLKLGGASLTQRLPLDGKDAWPTIAEGKPTPHEEIVIAAAPGTGAVRQGDWKFVRNGHFMSRNLPKGPDRLELFNLAEDPNEEHDLSKEHPQKFEELKQRLAFHTGQAVKPLGPPQRPENFITPKNWGHAD